MRIALISDLHANEVALAAVLEDIARDNVHRIICLGDLATLGPRPVEVVRMIKKLNCPCIMGNHDDFLNNPELLRKYTEAQQVVEAVDWAREQLSSEELEYLRTFSPYLEEDMGDGVKLFLYHGSPRSNMENILATTPPETLEEALDGRQADVLAGGHTHLQMLRQHKGMLIVNTGSVGMPFCEFVNGQPPEIMPHAEYAVIEVNQGVTSVSLRRVPLDRKKLLQAAKESTNPFRTYLIEQYQH